jgi:predicted component of type VI protein secretion system
MEYMPLFFLAWMVVSLPAIIVTLVANNRRRREAADLNDRIDTLTRQLEVLERRSAETVHTQPATRSVPAIPAMKISAEEARAAALTATAPVREPVVVERPAPTVSVPPPPPPPPAVVSPPIAAQAQPGSRRDSAYACSGSASAR